MPKKIQMAEGETEKLGFEFVLEKAEENVAFTSNDKTVSAVNEEGLLSAISKGKTEIVLMAGECRRIESRNRPRRNRFICIAAK